MPLHTGIPTDYVLADDDLVSVDFGATLLGWTGDAARSFVIGTPRAHDAALIEAADAALAAGIAAVRPGKRLGDIGHAISSTVHEAGFGLLADHGGHGSAQRERRQHIVLPGIGPHRGKPAQIDREILHQQHTQGK